MSRRLFLGLIFAFILLGIALDQQGRLSFLRSTIQTALAPLQFQTAGIMDQLFAGTELPSDVIILQERLQSLESVNNQLMVENVRLREIERENENLRQLLNYTGNNPQFTYQPTFVRGGSIGADPTNLLYYLYVDVGARDGVARDMPVLTDRGLVGRVTAVSPNAAQILMLIDPASAVNAVIQNSRATGIIRGNLDGTLIMERIPQGEQVSPGDIVLTSGLGGNFPGKLVIGQVTEVVSRDQELFQTARIRPTVDFGKLDILLILTSFEPVDFEAELRERDD